MEKRFTSRGSSGSSRLNTKPPSPPLDALHVQIEDEAEDARASEVNPEEEEEEYTALPRSNDCKDAHPKPDESYLELEEDETEKVESFLFMGEQDEEFTFVKYGPPYPAPKERDVHVDFKKSEMFQVHKAETDFTYMKTHETLKCSEVTWNDLEKDHLLDIIRKPREFQDKDGNLWHRRMSIEMNECEDIEELHENLDEELIKRQARTEGICPTRRTVHDDCFDELHRQILVDCPERAVLLQRCRMEIAETYAVMAHLFGSSFSYIMKQSAMSTGLTGQYQKELEIARQEKNALAELHATLLHRAEGEEDRLEHEKMQERDRMDKELEYLKTTETRTRNVLNRFTNIHTALRDAAAAKNKGDGGGEGKGDTL